MFRSRLRGWCYLASSTAAFCCVLTASGCGSTDPVLEDGDEVTGSPAEVCTGSKIQSALNLLCDLFVTDGNGGCINEKRSCNSYERQIFTGTALSSASKPGERWNGMGGTGERMADTVMCSLKELSSQLHGPIKNKLSVDVGIGTVSATQEIGFLDWRRVNPVFNGYRRLSINLPVLGSLDAVAQDFRVTKVQYSYIRDNEFQPPLAGNHPISDGFDLDILTQERSYVLDINPGSFPVTTPIGTFSVNPAFHYEHRASVIGHDKIGTDHTDVTPWLGMPNSLVQLINTYGENRGIAASDDYVTFSNFTQHEKGWISELALGNRDPRKDPNVWHPAPNSSIIQRPDVDWHTARSDDEAKPSVEVSASATLTYPDNPLKMLPSWVNDLPFLEAPTAYITVTPSLRAAVSDQLNVGFYEGAFFSRQGEFNFTASRAAQGLVWGGISMAAGFSIDVGLRLRIALDFPWPVGEVTLVDINPHFPVNFPELTKYAAMPTVLAASQGEVTDGKLGALSTWTTTATGKEQTEAYFSQCYAPDNDVPASPPPEPHAEEGDPSQLFPSDQLWPCNICIYVDALEVHENGVDVSISAKGDYVMPSVDDPSYQCNRQSKSGCMDWCSWDRETNTLHRVIAAEDLATIVVGSDDTYGDVVLGRPWINIRYDSCSTP